MTSPSPSSPQEAPRKPVNTGQLVASERLHTLGQLVAGVIHELNNPLTIVSTNLHVLTEYMTQQQALIALYDAAGFTNEAIAAYKVEIDFPYLEGDLPRILSSCQEGASRARSLVDELRRFSIANSPEVGPVDMKGNLFSTVRLVESSYRNRVNFVLDVSHLPPIMGIAGQIQQVLMNLLINACQAIEGNGEIRITSQVLDGNVILRLHDTGPGIAAHVLPRIFEPYFSTKAPTDGTGLGLPISKRICERHGGSLSVDSVLGQGTTFTITLPIEGSPSMADDGSSPYDL